MPISARPTKRKRKAAAPAGPTRIEDPATEWARAVVDGAIVSGDLMYRACERHLRDIVDGPRRGIHWRPERAAHALGFFPAVLPVTAGAAVGQPFRLLSWTGFAVGSLFGWRRDNGRMRYRHGWFELGKGQIKSPVMAAIGLYMMGWYGVARAEVYALAKDRNQANVLFQDAVNMCRATIPGEEEGTNLESREDVVIRGTGNMSWLIEHPATASIFRPLAGDERVNGPRPVLVLGDEIHEWRSGAPIETWQAAVAKMPGDALVLLGTNTPAADQLVGTEYSENYQRVLRREVDDDTAFALIARTDKDDKPLEDESCWRKSLPLLDITFPADNIRGEVNQARQRIAKKLTVERLYFGIPVGTSEYWIDLDAWEAVQGRVDAEAMRGRRCILSLDLAQKNDLCALGIGWDGPDGKLHAQVRYWKPKGRLADAQAADKAPYLQWIEPGPDGRPPLITAVPGMAIEYEFVATAVQQICAEQEVELLAFDPAHSSEFRKAADRIGFDTWVWTSPDEPEGTGLKMVIHGQGRLGMASKKALWMPRSLQRLEDLILTTRMVVDDSPVTKWCAGNAAIESDAQDNRYFVKKNSRGRIDGVVALAMLAGAAQAELGGAGSYTDTDEVLVF